MLFRSTFFVSLVCLTGCFLNASIVEIDQAGQTHSPIVPSVPSVPPISEPTPTPSPAPETLPISSLARTNGTINAAVHFGNSWIVGGTFNAVNSHPVSKIVELDLDGNILKTPCDLDSAVDGEINTIIHSNDSIFIGGVFSSYKGQVANNIAKIKTLDCTLDLLFSPSGNNGFDSGVSEIILMNNSIYVIGWFTSYRGVPDSSFGIAKLNSVDGTIDTIFSPPGINSNGINGYVSDAVVSSDSIYLAGDFTAYRGVPNSANNVAKLDLVTGNIDTIFSPPGATGNGFDYQAYALTVAGNALYVGGAFRSYRGVADSALNIAKLNRFNGQLDTTFSPVGVNHNGFISTNECCAQNVSVLATDGISLFVGGGYFTSYRGVPHSAYRFAKLDLITGILDQTFSPPGPTSNGFGGSYDTVNSLAIVGNKLFVGGSLNRYRGVENNVNNIAKIDIATGSLQNFKQAGDTSSGFNYPASIVYTGGHLYALGNFNSYGGQSANLIAKLDESTFALDESFSPPGNTTNGFSQSTGTFPPSVNSLVLSGSSLYVGGDFSSYRGGLNNANCIAKLDVITGVIDPVFSPTVSANSNGFAPYDPFFGHQVKSLSVSGNSLFIGGSFLNYRGVSNAAHHIAKVSLSTGELDTTFSPPGSGANGFNSSVNAVLATGDAVYVGGYMQGYRGIFPVQNLVKLDPASGILDSTFQSSNSQLDGPVEALAQSGSSLFIGGRFTTYDGVANSANGIAKINRFSGALDTSFGPPGMFSNGFHDGIYSQTVKTLAVSDSSLYVGGTFWYYRGILNSVNNLAKLDLITGNLDVSFNLPGLNANGVTNRNSLPMINSLVIEGPDLLLIGDFTHYKNQPAVNMFKIDLINGDPR